MTMAWVGWVVLAFLLACVVRLALVARSFRRSERRYRDGMYNAPHGVGGNR